MAIKIEIIESSKSISKDEIYKWYKNVIEEISAGYLQPEDRAYFTEYYHEAGMLRTWRRRFFMRHYAEPFADAANYLMAGPTDGARVVIDLGCGCGTQSIALALMGAKVIGLDMDRHALDILLRRKEFYQRESGRILDIEVHHGDVFKFDFESIGSIQGIYSMFAFNMMQPTSELLELLLPCLSIGGRIVIQDGNALSWLSKMPGRRREVLTPHALDQELANRGFHSHELRGSISLPPAVWNLASYRLLASLDHALCKSWFWPISYMAMYERHSAQA